METLSLSRLPWPVGCQLTSETSITRLLSWWLVLMDGLTLSSFYSRGGELWSTVCVCVCVCVRAIEGGKRTGRTLKLEKRSVLH